MLFSNIKQKFEKKKPQTQKRIVFLNNNLECALDKQTFFYRVDDIVNFWTHCTYQYITQVYRTNCKFVLSVFDVENGGDDLFGSTKQLFLPLSVLQHEISNKFNHLGSHICIHSMGFCYSSAYTILYSHKRRGKYRDQTENWSVKKLLQSRKQNRTKKRVSWWGERVYVRRRSCCEFIENSSDLSLCSRCTKTRNKMKHREIKMEIGDRCKNSIRFCSKTRESWGKIGNSMRN